MNKLSLLIFFLLRILSNSLFFFLRKDFLSYLYLHLRDKYSYIYILKKKIYFFTPNPILKWRIKTFYSKEPETLSWIDNFKNNNKIVFWDIGANVGLYSIYCSIKKKNIKCYAFEPSFLNLFPLSKNISLNNLEPQIKIMQIPLHNKNKSYFNFYETSKLEGGALSSFEFKKTGTYNKYSILGLRADYLIKNNFCKKPNYIKIDVDGNEYLILKGLGEYLKSNKLYEILVEIDENRLIEKKKILLILKKSGFKCYKKISNNFNNQIVENTSNYFFKRS